MRTAHPGVYIEELPSSVRTIGAVTTSVTAFVGHTRRGPLNQPVRITSFADFERRFGGLTARSAVGHAVHQFFGNGGSAAVIVRVAASGSGEEAEVTLESTEDGSARPVLRVTAREAGVWGSGLRVFVDHDTRRPDETFNLRITDANGEARESHTGLSMDPGHGRFVETVVNEGSELVRVRVTGEGRPTRPARCRSRSGPNCPTSPSS